jgi:hypothetical protein
MVKVLEPPPHGEYEILEVEVILRLMASQSVSQSVCLGVEPTLELMT